MTSVRNPQSREEIQREFDQLLRKHEAQASQISTKAEEAEREEARALVDRASSYTVESIVNDLAKLQLGFGTAVDDIADKLDGESSKLGELRRAIEVERGRLEQLQGTVVAAEALAILEQDHRQKLADLDERTQQARTKLAEDIAEVREDWKRDEAEQAVALQEHADQLAKEREQAEEDHAYELARQARMQEDAQTVKRREVERQLADEEAVKAKDWAAREKVLSDESDRIEELRTKVAGFADTLEQATKAAREKAIASVNREAKHELEMLGKEHDGNVKVFELKVKTLEARIARQIELIADLGTKLDATIAKSQNLAEQAFHRPTA